MTPESDGRAHEPVEGPVADTSTSAGPAPNTHARTRRHGPFTVVEVAGDIDLATAGFLAEHLDAATAGPEPDVLADLRRVDFFDCSGLRVLCRAEARASARGGRLRIVTGDPRLRRLLRAAGLLDRFPPLPGIPGDGE
ncbi:STAS domain-containing protein [Streptomyces sp. GESEQ-35]|uniref:STAS domain-containing protein n=1 Tax=Streptomyces sp. GESEQ-35 TaxID=2812657 RepID=UPI001B338E40|nr:STAS domain-containing protein [Streptomyces sp. GESEQ-35]